MRSEARQTLGKRAATDRFAYLYNQRQAPGLDPNCTSTVKRLSKISAIRVGTPVRGKRDCRADIAKRAVEKGRDDPSPRSSAIPDCGNGAKSLHSNQGSYIACSGPNFPTLSRVRLRCVDFCAVERAADPAMWTLAENPDAFKSKYQLALGNAVRESHAFPGVRRSRFHPGRCALFGRQTLHHRRANRSIQPKNEIPGHENIEFMGHSRPDPLDDPRMGHPRERHPG